MSTLPIGPTLTKTLQETVDFVQKHLQPILVGAAVFGLLTWGVGYALVGRQAGMWMQKAGQMERGAEEWTRRMEGVEDRMAAGDLTDEQAAEMARDFAAQGLGAAGITGGMLGGLFAGVGLMMLVMVVVGIVSRAYYTLIAIKGLTDANQAVSLATKWVWPMFLLGAWMVLRSFLWVPIVGIFIAIALMPRFILAPIYLIEQGKGVTESVRLSYERTRGMWLSILVIGIVIGIITMIISGILGAVFGMFGMLLGGMLQSVLGEVISAVSMIAMILLGRTILSQPATAPAAVTPPVAPTAQA